MGVYFLKGISSNITGALDQLFDPSLFSLILYAGVQNVSLGAGTAEITGGIVLLLVQGANFYALATVSGGPVSNSPDYFYTGTHYEAAVELGQASIRYMMLDNNWAPDGNKSLKSHVITVGIRFQ